MKKMKGIIFALILMLAVTVVCDTPARNLLAAGPIIVGIPTSLGLLEGKESLNAVQMAVNEINAAGGIQTKGERQLLAIESIDLGDADPSVPVYAALFKLEKLLKEKKPTAILVGPHRSDVLTAGMDIVAKYRVPLIATLVMDLAVDKKLRRAPDKYKYIFRTCPNSLYLVLSLAGNMDFLYREFGFNKVYIMHQDESKARTVAGMVKKAYFDRAGWNVVGVEAFPAGTSDFSSALNSVRDKGAQVVVPIFDMPQSGVLVKQWQTVQDPALLCGFISPLTGSEAWKASDGKIGGSINIVSELGGAVYSKRVPPSKVFYDQYKQIYGREMQVGHGPASSYESVYILKEAIERADSLEADAIVAELEKTDRQGVMGRIRYDSGHQAVYGFDPQKTAVSTAIQWTGDGKRVIVFPDSIAEAGIQLPPGLKPLN